MSQVNNEFFPMEVVCAWCGLHMYWAYCREPDKTSHGICGGCSKKAMSDRETEKLPGGGDNKDEMQNL